MKKIIISAFIVSATLMYCSENFDSVIGKWEENKDATSTEAFEITKEGSRYFIDFYTYYKQRTKYVKLNSDTTIMNAGGTTNHKKYELFYDCHKKIYTVNDRKLLININVVNSDHLEIKLPLKTKIYSRLSPLEVDRSGLHFPLAN